MWLALAVAALLTRVASPPGTMVAATGHGARLVLCDGHGPMMMASGKSMSRARGPVSPTKTHSGGGCEFAAHASHALTATTLGLVGHFAWTPAARAQPVVLATTGHGLAAPPPPSHAPPAILA